MEILALGAIAFAALLVFAVLASVFGLVLWLVLLPFRIAGWALQALGFLLALPFIAAFGLAAFLVLGAGMLFFLVPLLPLALLVAGLWWLVRRPGRSAPPATS